MSQGGEHLPHGTLRLIQGSHSIWLRAGQSCSSVLQGCKPHRNLFCMPETTGSQLKKTAFICTVLIGLIQQMEGKYSSAVETMNGRPAITLRSNSEGEKVRPRPAVLAVPQQSVPLPLNNTTLPWIFHPSCLDIRIS